MYGWVLCQPNSVLLLLIIIMGKDVDHFHHHGNFDHCDDDMLGSTTSWVSPSHSSLLKYNGRYRNGQKIPKLVHMLEMWLFLFCRFEMFFFTCRDTSFSLINVYLSWVSLAETCEDLPRYVDLVLKRTEIDTK